MKDGLSLRVNELLNVFRQVTLLGKLTRKLAGLGLRRDLAREEEPEHALGDNLLSTRGGSESLLTVRDSQAMEPNTLYERKVRTRNKSMHGRITSLGSRTDASQSIALRPLMPPTTCST